MALLDIQLSSDYVNVINFVLFDVLLISLIFFFTTDVSGRLNYLSLLDGSTKSLVVISPPLIGGGLCSTSKLRSGIMLAVRIVGITLIFATAFTIDGKTIEKEGVKLETVRVPGPIPENMTRVELEAAANLQKSCQISSQGYIYHGRLSKNGACEADPRFLQGQIRIQAEPQLINATLMCEKKLLDSDERMDIFEYQCLKQSSFIQCFLAKNKFYPSGCLGIVQTAGAKFLCETFNDMKNDTTSSIMSWSGQCRKAINLDRVRDYWRRAALKSSYPFDLLIGAVSILRLEEQEVKYIEKTDITVVHKIWFGFFAAKFALVILLFVFSAWLRVRGVRCILHDEHALMQLLRINISQKSGIPNDQVELYIHGTSGELQQRKSFWVSNRPQSRPTNTAVHELEMVHY